MLERFQEETKKLTAGQKWRFRRFLWRLEERDLDPEEIEEEVLEYLQKELGIGRIS
jgi:hypothetical protein